MVRLKSTPNKPNHNRCNVSIPNGSIKIFYLGVQGLRCKVSIPNGSIKIHSSDKESCLWTWFQFQMVRLKYEYGLQKQTEFKGFQFQMVRLKCVCFEVGSPAAKFQFQMVRLKYLTPSKPKSRTMFQFQMVRLKLIWTVC